MKSNNELVALWQSELNRVAHPQKVEALSRFFKTGVGEYAAGDVFIGVTVPDNRGVAKMFHDAPFEVIAEMLSSRVHEHRLSGFLALVQRFKRARCDAQGRLEVVDFYLRHARDANNWDLVDLSAPYIIGAHLADTHEYDMLYRLAASDNLWEQRIAIVATWGLLRVGVAGPTMEIAQRYITHGHDLIQKATGWMLREMGKRVSTGYLCDFLDKHAAVMPRTMLRYAIEKLPAQVRKEYMSKGKLSRK